jgi:hypothetical protein
MFSNRLVVYGVVIGSGADSENLDFKGHFIGQMSGAEHMKHMICKFPEGDLTVGIVLMSDKARTRSDWRGVRIECFT